MRIAFLRSNPINPDVRLEKEIYSLVKAGEEITALGWDRECIHKKKEKRYINGCSYLIYRIRQKASFGGGIKKNFFPLVIFELKLGCWIWKNRKKYDVIHACDFDTALMAFLIGKVTGKKYIYDIFDYYVDCYHVPNYLKGIIEKIDHLVIKSAYKTILCTEKRINQIGIKEKNDYLIIHNSPMETVINKDDMKLMAGSQKERIKIVYVGGLSADRFLKELVDSVQVTPEAELHIGGFGPLEGFIQSAGSKYGNVFFYGKISYHQTLALESQCDYLAALYPTDNRNHIFAAPNKFYEALMLKKPIIMIKGSGTSDLVEENSLGILIGSSENEVYTMVKQIKDIDKAEFDCEKGYCLYLEKYQWTIMAERLAKLYKGLAEQMQI